MFKHNYYIHMNIIFNNISTATDECILNFKYSLENKLHKCPK